MRSIVTPCSDIPGRRGGGGMAVGGMAAAGRGMAVACAIRQQLTGPNVPGDGGKCPW